MVDPIIDGNINPNGSQSQTGQFSLGLTGHLSILPEVLKNQKEEGLKRGVAVLENGQEVAIEDSIKPLMGFDWSQRDENGADRWYVGAITAKNHQDVSAAEEALKRLGLGGALVTDDNSIGIMANLKDENDYVIPTMDHVLTLVKERQEELVEQARKLQKEAQDQEVVASAETWVVTADRTRAAITIPKSKSDDIHALRMALGGLGIDNQSDALGGETKELTGAVTVTVNGKDEVERLQAAIASAHERIIRNSSFEPYKNQKEHTKDVSGNALGLVWHGDKTMPTKQAAQLSHRFLQAVSQIGLKFDLQQTKDGREKLVFRDPEQMNLIHDIQSGKKNAAIDYIKKVEQQYSEEQVKQAWENLSERDKKLLEAQGKGGWRELLTPEYHAKEWQRTKQFLGFESGISEDSQGNQINKSIRTASVHPLMLGNAAPPVLVSRETAKQEPVVEETTIAKVAEPNLSAQDEAVNFIRNRDNWGDVSYPGGGPIPKIQARIKTDHIALAVVSELQERGFDPHWDDETHTLKMFGEANVAKFFEKYFEEKQVTTLDQPISSKKQEFLEEQTQVLTKLREGRAATKPLEFLEPEDDVDPNKTREMKAADPGKGARGAVR